MWSWLFGNTDKSEKPLLGNEKKITQLDNSNFKNVPNDVMKLIITKLPNEDIASISRTSKRMNQIAEETETYLDIPVLNEEEKFRIEGTYFQIRNVLNDRMAKEQKINEIKPSEVSKYVASDTNDNITKCSVVISGVGTIGGGALMAVGITPVVNGVVTAGSILSIVGGALAASGGIGSTIFGCYKPHSLFKQNIAKKEEEVEVLRKELNSKPTLLSMSKS